MLSATNSGKLVDEDYSQDEAQELMRELMEHGVVQGSFEKVSNEDEWTITSAQMENGDSLDPNVMKDFRVKVRSNSGGRELVSVAGTACQVDVSLRAYIQDSSNPQGPYEQTECQAWSLVTSGVRWLRGLSLNPVFAVSTTKGKCMCIDARADTGAPSGNPSNYVFASLLPEGRTLSNLYYNFSVGDARAVFGKRYACGVDLNQAQWDAICDSLPCQDH